MTKQEFTELPEHIEWVHNVAIPKLESWGVPVDVVKGVKDYRHFFHNAVGGGDLRANSTAFQ